MIQFLCIIVPSCLLIISGLFDLVIGGNVENNKLINYIMAVTGFLSFLFDRMRFQELEEGLSLSSPSTWFLMVISGVFIYTILSELFKKEITVRGITWPELVNELHTILSRYNITYQDEDECILLNDFNASIKLRSDIFRENVLTLKFKGYRDIPHIDEILEDLKELIDSRDKKRIRFSPIFSIVSGIAFIFVGINLYYRMIR